MTGGLIVAGAAAAQAADDDGLLAGLGIEAPVDISVDLSGLAAGIGGDATTTPATPAAADPAPGAAAPTATVTGGDSSGIASGAGVAAPVNVPVDVSGVAIGVLGDASTTSAPAETAPAASGTDAPTATVDQGSSDGAVSGASVAAPVNVPVSVDGVAIGVLGDASTTSAPAETAPAASGTDAPTATVDGGDSEGILGGTGVAAPVNVPVTVGDVALGLLGDATVTDGTGTASDSSTGSAPVAEVGSGSSRGILGGTGVAAPISVPVTVGDVALGLLGDASTSGTTGTAPATGSAPAADVSSGDSDGILGGTGVAAPISIPITIGDLALGLLGDAAVTGGTGTGAADGPVAVVSGGDGDGLLTDLGVAAPINLPITVRRLAVGAIGDATVAGVDPSTDPGTDPGFDPDIDVETGPGTGPGTDDGTSGTDSIDDGTGVAVDGGAGVTTVADTVLLSDVLAAADLATRGGATLALPAALAPTGGPAGLVALAALALIGLGVGMRRVRAVVLH
ncbi:MAG TPA: chaplin family protein [Cellulomonas sp.]